jgi:hypothetical protein
MTSRGRPHECTLRAALGEHERCPGASCAFWEPGGAALEPGCAIERLSIPVHRHRELARHLLDLRLRLEEARDEAERRDAHRRFAELVDLDGD